MTRRARRAVSGADLEFDYVAGAPLRRGDDAEGARRSGAGESLTKELSPEAVMQLTFSMAAANFTDRVNEAHDGSGLGW